ncbi:MAG TPA: HAMP domain-containing sensor histidine kinase [Symbiobacteriaceae bacterium]|jgi:signal transduction histidine kinase
MRRLNIVAKLWLAFTCLILVVVIPLELALDKLLGDFYAQQVTEPLIYHSDQLAHMLAGSDEALGVAGMMGQMVGGEVLVLGASGQPRHFEGSSAMVPPPQAVAVVETGMPFTGQALVSDGRQVIITAVAIPGGRGAVVLIAPAEPVQRSLSQARRYLWLAFAGTLLLGTGLALMLSRSVLRPVIAIEQATTHIARGDFATRVEWQSRDELGRLATAVNQMTTQLEGYERRRREFLANVAHELRTPLSYIRGYAQAVAEGLVGDAEERERYLRIVQEESVRLGRLVDDLLDLAQMEEGQMSFNMVALDISLPIEQAVAAISLIAEQKGVRVEADVPPGLPLVRADGGRMQQVVVNLLDNGLRYTEAGGLLRVTAWEDAGSVQVNVTDSGPGIDADQLPLIFERFHKRHSSGRGLGLAIVRTIVRAHDGEVGVDSELGTGSTFWFRLRAPSS